MEEISKQFTNDIIISGKYVAVRQAAEMTLWMKANHVWTNRTFRAEEGLLAFVDESVGPIGVIVYQHNQTIDYAMWLELMDFGKWSILGPTKDYWEPRLQRSLQNMANLKVITKG